VYRLYIYRHNDRKLSIFYYSEKEVNLTRARSVYCSIEGQL
jgi:hypothetical protein